MLTDQKLNAVYTTELTMGTLICAASFNSIISHVSAEFSIRAGSHYSQFCLLPFFGEDKLVISNILIVLCLFVIAFSVPCWFYWRLLSGQY